MSNLRDWLSCPSVYLREASLGVAASSLSAHMHITILFVLLAWLIWIAILAVSFVVTFIAFYRRLYCISIFSFSVI